MKGRGERSHSPVGGVDASTLDRLLSYLHVGVILFSTADGAAKNEEVKGQVSKHPTIPRGTSVFKWYGEGSNSSWGGFCELDSRVFYPAPSSEEASMLLGRKDSVGADGRREWPSSNA